MNYEATDRPRREIPREPPTGKPSHHEQTREKPGNDLPHKHEDERLKEDKRVWDEKHHKR